MPNTERVQINLRVSPDLAARLDNLAAIYNKRSRNQVAEEIVEQCVDLYEQSEVAKYAVLRRALLEQNAKEQ